MNQNNRKRKEFDSKVAKNRQNSTFRKNLDLMKGIHEEKACKKSFQRDISRRTRDAQKKHEERMRKARVSQSPHRQYFKTARSTSRCKKRDTFKGRRSIREFYSPHMTNPTNYTSNPFLLDSKRDSSFVLSTALKSVCKL